MRLTFGTGALARSADPRGLVGQAIANGFTKFELAADDPVAVAALANRPAERLELSVRMTPTVRFDLPSPHISAAQAWPGGQLRAEVEGLLRQLGQERIAVLQLHAWCPEWLGEGDWRDTAERLQIEGKIGGIGISLFDHDVDAALEAIDRTAVDSVQVMFNLFDTGAALNLFPLARERGVAVVARSPLYYGMLAQPEPSLFDPGDWRANFFIPDHRRETASRVKAILPDLLSDETLSDVALRFAASHPAVSSVAIGLRTPGQIDAAVTAIQRGPLPPHRLRALLAHRWLCLTS